MIKPRILGLSLLLLASTGEGVAGAGMYLPPQVELTELQSTANGSNYGRFDGHGKLLVQNVSFHVGPGLWYSTLAYFPVGGFYEFKLHRNVSAVNIFLAAEIRRPRTIDTFLHKYLALFLWNNFGEAQTSPIIRAELLKEGINGYLIAKDIGTSAARRRQLKAKLISYAGSEEPVISGNSWRFDTHVITAEGAVEHWLVKGRVIPLQIDSYLCESKEPNHTFQPLVVTGNG